MRKEEQNMTCKEIMETIEAAYPVKYALDWDNVGLLAGRDDKDVKCIYIALDATDETVDAAIREQADMLVTHHPLIFGGLKRIHNRDFVGRRLLRLIGNDISYYAMHTNYDVCRMGRLAGEKMGFLNPRVLEVTCEEEKEMGIGEIADLPSEMTLEEFSQAVKGAFRLEHVRVFGEPGKKVSRAAVCPGSGKSAIRPAIAKGADVLVTGDIGHHEGIDCVAQGLAVIDAGHYGVEHIFIGNVKEFLSEKLDGIRIVAEPVSNPFHIV